MKLSQKKCKIGIGNTYLNHVQLVENDKRNLKPLPKNEKKSMKHKYRVAQRVYASTYTNIAEKFKIYLYSLTSDKIDEIQRDF